MHFLITGHTGFKGSWLVLLLRELGHEVSGYALAPTSNGLFSRARLEGDLKNHFIADIRDKNALLEAFSISKPDLAIHMAAQPLVLRSYEKPSETFTTNVDGTRIFLEVISGFQTSPTALVVTTDKVYKESRTRPHVETDALGGSDPYSASKAMADILSQSWAETHAELNLKIARAGNVIGAFDVSENRLIPDIVRSVKDGTTLQIRNPSHVRPWQHVLDCLAGYLLFLKHARQTCHTPLALNFGPEAVSNRSVWDIALRSMEHLPNLRIERTDQVQQTVETELLALDSSLAKSSLGWNNILDFDTALEWSLAELGELDPRELVLHQIRSFISQLEKAETNPRLKTNDW